LSQFCLGSKKDCFTYGFDIVEDDIQLNMYGWSNPPSLREQSEEAAKVIHNSTSSSSLQRTVSSSSSCSNTLSSKQKKRKLDHKNTNIDELVVVDDASMPPPSTSLMISSAQTSNSATADVVPDVPSTSNNQSSSSASNSTLNTTNMTTSSIDTNSLLEEIKSLREKVLSLQNELLYQRQSSMPLPSEETYNYFKSSCVMYEQIKSENNKQSAELGKKLPCTNIELKLAKSSNPSATINNLIKCCLKNIDLKTMSYDKLKKGNAELLERILQYVRLIHAPTDIPQAKFSSVISLKCRHIRSNAKHGKSVSTTTKEKQKQKRNEMHDSNNHEGQKRQVVEATNKISIKDMDEEKENEDEII
ncbi:unnamed protein product, partial [Rotaria sp. Silwood2]